MHGIKDANKSAVQTVFSFSLLSEICWDSGLSDRTLRSEAGLLSGLYPVSGIWAQSGTSPRSRQTAQ